jgi:16S rRNA G1207 methylase RsmC
MRSISGDLIGFRHAICNLAECGDVGTDGKSSRAFWSQSSENASDSALENAAMTSMQRFAEVLRTKVKPPMAVVLGAPGEVCALLDHLRFESTICYQMDLYPADRLRDSLGEQKLQAEVVAAADAWDVPGVYASVVYIAPEAGERSLKLDMVEQGFHLVKPGGTFYVLSPYQPDSFFAAVLKKVFGPVHATPVGDGTVFWCTRNKERPKRRHEVNFHARDGDQTSRAFISRPGVFSYGRLDDGARALTDCMTIEPGEQILDLGCGCGATGIFAGLRGGPESRVHFVDSNTRAIVVATLNATRNELPNFTTQALWQPERLAVKSADVILANPPYFGRGEIAARFVEHARAALKPNGRLYLVTKLTELVGDLLTETFREVDAVEARGYVVLSAQGKK